MAETQHLSEYEEDDDGFVVVRCSCGWGPFPAPDYETAGDAFADHMREVGQIEVAERHQADWSNALTLLLDFQGLAEDLLIVIEANAEPSDDTRSRNLYRPLAARLESLMAGNGG